MSDRTMGAERCYRFSKCNANICPLDRDYLKRKHVDGESVCALLREVAKHEGRLPKRPNISREIAAEVDEAFESIRDQFWSIRSALKRAANLPSKLGRSPSRDKSDRSVRSSHLAKYPIGERKLPYCRPRDVYLYTIRLYGKHTPTHPSLICNEESNIGGDSCG